MPTYAYLCESCGHRLEAFQSMSARPLRKCPACGERRLQRLIGAGAGVIFKGSGFYQTDYRGKSYQESAKKDAEPAASGGDGGKAADKGADKPATGKGTADKPGADKAPSGKEGKP